MIPATYLYHLIPVDAGGADGLFTSLENILEEDGVGWEKVIGYALDSENLMQGENNSVLTRIKDALPDIYILKCCCHLFHLDASYAYECPSKRAEQLVHDIQFLEEVAT